MLKDTRTIYEEGENTYFNGKFQVQILDSYIHSDAQLRPGVLVVPGGGYDHISPNENENVAMRFYELGYQAFVLTYTVDETKSFPLKDQPLKDISRAVRMIRANGAEFKLYENKLAVCGFSAGGHLTASLCVHHEDIKDDKYPEVSNRPDVAILSYPVITTGNYAHASSVHCLLGDMATLEELKYMSVEKQVTADTPPAFIWTTAGDMSVPIENSELYAKALRDNGVPFALHIFSEGSHGRNLGYASEKGPEIHEITVWPELADCFLTRYF